MFSRRSTYGDPAGGLIVTCSVPFAGIAGEALRTLLTRGRQPGVTRALATQRPDALPAVALSQTDLLVAHRLTAKDDIDALARASPSYLRGEVEDRLPSRPGEALVIDDTGEEAYTIRVRERDRARWDESAGESIGVIGG